MIIASVNKDEHRTCNFCVSRTPCAIVLHSDHPGRTQFVAICLICSKFLAAVITDTLIEAVTNEQR